MEHDFAVDSTEEEPADHKECQSYEIIKTYKCQNAGCAATKVERETIEATKDHNFQEETETLKEATCTAPGTKVTYNKCKVCGTKVPLRT